MSEIRIGISGWRYAPWRGKFYPEGLPQHRELEFASRQVNSIELNGSFYSLQRPKLYQKWALDTPAGFIFSVKGSRYITHTRRLDDIGAPLANFFASGVLALEEKLGPFLWQFPPSLKYDAKRFKKFFDLLPTDTQAASRLARKHDPWMKDRAFTSSLEKRPLRHAIEIRNPSFVDPEFFTLLKDYGHALVIADTAGKWPYLEEITTDFVYARLHGDQKIYVSGYTERALNAWAKKVKGWTRGRAPKDVYIYFDNDVKVHAPEDAISLLEKTTDFEPQSLLKAA